MHIPVKELRLSLGLCPFPSPLWGSPQAGYGPMIHVRANIVAGAAAALARVLTIAVRFSAVRRQGGAESGPERPVCQPW
jgi:hypothetical protein